MENDQTSMTPVEASNRSAALPGSADSPGPAAASGGASAAYGGASTAAPAAAAPSPVTEPYATMTTPTAVNVPNPRAKPFHGPTPRVREDVAESPAFGARGARSMPWAAPAIKPAEKQFLDFVSEGEGPGGYNQRFGEPAGKPRYDLTNMTINEVVRLPPNRANGFTSTASGRYQFLSGTLAEMRDRLGLTGDEMFDEGMQDYLAVERMRQMRKYDQFLAGEVSREQFAINVADEWASLPDVNTGMSRHRRQPVAHSPADLLAQVDALKSGTILGPPSADSVPNPRPRPSGAADPATGAAGARSMPDLIPGSPSAAYGPAPPAEAGPAMPALVGVINTDGDLLVRGAKGDATREWQQFLSEAGYTDAQGRPIAVDGDFGRRTREATKQFQIASQIEADGMVGPETLSAALYTIDPESSPMPGQVAYADGANTAQKIIDPTAPEVAIPLPRQRPERGAGVPNPPANPRRDPDGFMVDVSRPRLDNGDGSFSTEETATFEVNGEFINIPTIVDGKRLTPDQAYAAYEDGSNKPVQWGFKSEAEAVAAAKRRSDYIATARGTAGETQPAQWSSVDEMTQVDENGNYINPVPGRPETPGSRVLYGPAEVGKMTSDYRDGLLANGYSAETVNDATSAFEKAFKESGQYRFANGLTPAEVGKMASDFREKLISQGVSGDVLDMAVTTYENAAKTSITREQRVSAATGAARRTMAQRLSGTKMTIDRFRPRDAYRAIEAERVREAEALREFVRGIADTYLKVRDRSRTAPVASPDPERQPLINDALMRAAPTPAETVIEAYAFRRRA